MAPKTMVAVALALTFNAVYGQTFRGAIQGTVNDSSGAGVPHAQVTVTGEQTKFARRGVTDDYGNYLFIELPLGAYMVTATKNGFQKHVVTGIDVKVADFPRVDLTLTPGPVSEIVEVRGSVPLVQTVEDYQGGTIAGRQASELPINGRDFMKTMLLIPGATADPSSVSDAPGSFGMLSINGSRGRSNNYLLDGTDMNDSYHNSPAISEPGVWGTPATILPLDALAEIPVVSGADAQFGRNSGAIVNLVTKSGTNQFHGAMFEYFRNSALDARNFFNTIAVPQNPFHNNQFGGSLGGPIDKNKTFFFLAYEGQREYGGLTSLGHVPTQEDISAALVSPTVVNAGGESPIIANLLARHPWPAANIATDSNGNNLLATTRFSNRLDSMIAKVDHQFASGDMFTVRYLFGDSDQSYPLALVGGGNLPGFNTITPTRVQVVSLSYTHVFAPRLLFELRGGYNRFFETFSPEDQSFDPRSIGLNTAQNGDLGLPQINVAGEATLGANTSLPRGRVDTNWHYLGNTSYNAGRNNWKAGYEFRRTFVNGFFDNGYRGRLLFPDLENFLAGLPSGNLTSSNHQATGDSRRGTFQNNHALYLQDSIKLTHSLAFNAGLRWDYFGVIGEERDRFSIFDPAIAGPRQLKQLYPKDWNNFAPRVSLAYDVRGDAKTVVRAGWGLFYDAFSQDFFVGQLPFNTFNAGPAYNDIGGPAPILFSSTASLATTAGPCSATAIPVPHSSLCALPVFSNFGATDVFTVDQHIRTPYIQNYNLNVQQQLASGVVLQIGYVGSAGRKLFRYRDLNQSVGGGPLPYPDLVYINQFESTATSNYNGLQTSLRLRTHGMTSNVNYTWSHSIDTASDGLDFVPNASQPDNSVNAHNERASSNFDARQRFSWNFVYELPRASRHQFLQGWTLNGILSVQTGQPVNVNYLFEGDFNGSGEYFGRPDLMGDPKVGRNLPNAFLNAEAFAVPCAWDAAAGSCVPGTQHFGNLGRNVFNGPSFKQFDFSLVKNTRLSEKLSMQWRVDCFNVFNHPNFTNPLLPGFSVDFLNGSLPGSNGRGTGSIPITATADVGNGNPYLGGGGPRNLQLAVRFQF